MMDAVGIGMPVSGKGTNLMRRTQLSYEEVLDVKPGLNAAYRLEPPRPR